MKTKLVALAAGIVAVVFLVVAFFPLYPKAISSPDLLLEYYRQVPIFETEAKLEAMRISREGVATIFQDTVRSVTLPANYLQQLGEFILGEPTVPPRARSDMERYASSRTLAPLPLTALARDPQDPSSCCKNPSFPKLGMKLPKEMFE